MSLFDRLFWRYLSWRMLHALDLADKCAKGKKRLVRKYARAQGCCARDVAVDERGEITVRVKLPLACGCEE